MFFVFVVPGRSFESAEHDEEPVGQVGPFFSFSFSFSDRQERKKAISSLGWTGGSLKMFIFAKKKLINTISDIFIGLRL
jgi:hypothetical protein